MYSLLIFSLASFGTYSCVRSSCMDINYSENCKWPYTFPACGGNQQSPISLSSETLKNCEPSPINFINFDFMLTLTMVNEGYVLNDYFTSDLGQEPVVEVYGERYVLKYGQPKVGTLVTPGSEHTIDGVRFSAEYTVVFRNEKLCPSVASDYYNGHLRISRLIEIVDANHPNLHKVWDPQLDLVGSVESYNSSVMVPVKVTLSEQLGLDLPNCGPRMPAYIYWGSESHPPCFSALNVVFHEPLYVSHPKLIDFMAIKNERGYPNINNFRSLQDLNGRQVTGIC